METLMRILMKLLYGLTASQWKSAIEIVLDLASNGGDGKQKAFLFNQEYARIVSKFQNEDARGILDTIRQNAWALAKKKGWIK